MQNYKYEEMHEFGVKFHILQRAQTQAVQKTPRKLCKKAHDI